MSFHLLLAIVKDDEMVEELMTGFLELGIGGATVVHGHGMAEIISEQLPLFAGFRDVFKAGGTSRVILTVVPDAKLEPAFTLFEELRADHGDLGVAFSLPVDRTFGLRSQEEDILED